VVKSQELSVKGVCHDCDIRFQEHIHVISRNVHNFHIRRQVFPTEGRISTGGALLSSKEQDTPSEELRAIFPDHEPDNLFSVSQSPAQDKARANVKSV
jgi:hypothetical protein